MKSQSRSQSSSTRLSRTNLTPTQAIQPRSIASRTTTIATSSTVTPSLRRGLSSLSQSTLSNRSHVPSICSRRTFTTTADGIQSSDPTSPEQGKVYTDPRVAFQNAISDDMLVTLSMNYNNSGNSHVELCDNLRKNNLISTPMIEYAFRKSDRRYFDPSQTPYEDKPHDIGGGATISAPHMHAISLEALADSIVPVNTRQAPIPTKKFCDIGSGSGFVTSVFAHIIDSLRSNPLHADNAQASRVVGVEIHPGLAEQSIQNIKRTKASLIDVGDGQPIVKITNKDAFAGEIIPEGPFDAVHVGVASNKFPLTVLAQLKPGGQCVAPIKLGPQHGNEQDLVVFTRLLTSTTSTADFVKQALQVLETNDDAAIQAFTKEHFSSKKLLRCLFVDAKDASNVPISLSALDPEKAQQSNARFSKFFQRGGDNPDLSPEEAAKSRDEFKKQQLQELSMSAQKLQAELNSKKAELDKTSEDIKVWHEEYILKHNGKKPSFSEMNSDRYVANLLKIVKELRTQVAKTERSLNLIQEKEKNIDA